MMSWPSSAHVDQVGAQDSVCSAIPSTNPYQHTGPVSKKHTPRGDNPTTEDPLYARQKPDISAPGVKIFSAYSMTNDSYTTMSGTSMATPHVSGVIALVMAALDQQAAAGVLSSSSDASQVAFRMSQSSQDAPPLSLYDTVYGILKDSAIRTGLGKPLGGGGARLPLPGWPVQEQCEHTGYQTWPNLFYGWGLLDAYAAVKLALERVVV